MACCEQESGNRCLARGGNNRWLRYVNRLTYCKNKLLFTYVLHSSLLSWHEFAQDGRVRLDRRGIILQEANPMSDVFRNIDPSPPGECVYPPPSLVRGEGTLAGWRGGGGYIVRKTPETALYSEFVSTLWT